MSDRAPYSRVYWTIRNDARLREIYPNNGHLATWLRLLIAADMAWPAPADLPSSVNKRSLSTLVEAGVIELHDGGLFTFHGLDTERGRRKAFATSRPSSGPQVVPTPDPSGFATQGLSRVKGKTSKDEPSSGDPADTYWSLTGRYPTDKVLKWIDDLAAQYGVDALVAAIAGSHQLDPDASTLLGRATTALKRDARKLDLEERRAVEVRIAENRKLNPQLLISRHNNGQHEAAADPACPACRSAAA